MAAPAADTEKAVPSSTDEESPDAAGTAGSRGPNSDCSGPPGLAVVNCHVSGASVAPWAETTLPTLAESTVAAGSGWAGENVMVWASAERAEVPATAAPSADRSKVKPAWMGADNVTVGFDVSGKPTESAAGIWAVT